MSENPFSVKFASFREVGEERLRSYSPYLHYKLTHNLKPLSQFLNLQRISIPKSVNEVKERISNNFIYFNGNYIVLMLLITLLTLLLTNFYLFLSIVVLIIGFFYLQTVEIEDIEIEISGNKFILNKKTLYIVLILITVPVIIITKPIGSILEIVGYSMLVIGVHSSLIEGYQSETSFNETVV